MTGCADLNPFPDAGAFRRSPDTVMRLARMGSFHQTRLSFMRTLLRRMRREKWEFDSPVWDFDDKGVGCAVYRARGPRNTYSLVAFGHDLPDEMRSDRVIATAWDATFTLVDGEPTAEDLNRLSRNVPKQEAGRVSAKELCLSRANRSVRLWDHVVERLAAGQQPDPDMLNSVGYLMRTTAVYGSGKFGAADRDHLTARSLMSGPFRAEMLSVYLIRAFTADLVEHMAWVRGGNRATTLDPVLRRRLGVGNATGLGMAPFLINHPVLINNWMMAREEALARVRATVDVRDEARETFREMLARAIVNAGDWHSVHPLQQDKLAQLRGDLRRLEDRVETEGLNGERPWDGLYRWAEAELTLEGQEQLVALLLEPYGDIVDDLVDCMDADEDAAFSIAGTMTVGTLRALCEKTYPWALETDYSVAAAQARFWYVSEEKLEPRLGERFEEPGAEYEQPLAIGRDAAAMVRALKGWQDDVPVANFLIAHPEHRHVVRRAQMAARHPFAEVRDNLIDAKMLPIDLLRCKLSFFGATRFDPRSDRWVRICMYQNAPFPHELAVEPEDDWAYPALSGGARTPAA